MVMMAATTKFLLRNIKKRKERKEMKELLRCVALVDKVRMHIRNFRERRFLKIYRTKIGLIFLKFGMVQYTQKAAAKATAQGS